MQCLVHAIFKAPTSFKQTFCCDSFLLEICQVKGLYLYMKERKREKREVKDLFYNSCDSFFYRFLKVRREKESVKGKPRSSNF